MPDQVVITGMSDIERQTERLPILLREKVITAANNAAGQVVVKAAKTFVTQPGYPGDKTQENALRDLIAKRTKHYGDKVVTVCGPRREPGAFHGHMVEGGHKTPDGGGWVPAHPFMEPAADSTKTQQIAAYEAAAKRRTDQLLR